jgi:Family of unknown function (DUF5694)
MKSIFLFLGFLAISLVSCAQSDARPEILVLGTYHMANRGRDIFNLQADDDLSPKRQLEIAQVIEVLKKFHPTKIAIEADIENPQAGRDYSDYVAGKYTLSRDETNQIGYRLAKDLGHHAVYPINVEGEFPMQRVANFAKAHGSSDKLDALTATFGAEVKQEQDFLLSHTVLEMLGYLNSDSVVARDVAQYYAVVPFGESGDYAGPDLLALWYERNVRIYHNIVALIDSPSDRILVIYGAGHLGWLQQDVANDASARLRKLSELTGR